MNLNFACIVLFLCWMAIKMMAYSFNYIGDHRSEYEQSQCIFIYWIYTNYFISDEKWQSTKVQVDERAIHNKNFRMHGGKECNVRWQ